MNKKILIIMAVAVFFTLTISTVYGYQALQGPTELIFWDKEKAYNGYTLFGAKRGRTNDTFLIDMEGNLVHHWPDTERHPYLLENGNILTRGLKELDWDGNIVWEFNLPEDRPDQDKLHHDQVRIFNKKLNAPTTIVISRRHLSKEDALAAGADPKKTKRDCYPDSIIEVDMKGNIVWEWWSFDHVIQDIDPTKPNYVGEGKTIADYPGKLDMNWGRGVSGDFVHFNSIDYNPVLGQIAVNNSFGSEFWIINHDGTFIPGDPAASRALSEGPAGDIVYRWGNPGIYGAGKEPSWEYGVSSLGDQQVFFTHDIQWIKPGLPGAGNFLYFDNGSKRPGPTFSQVLEINPYDGPMENGIYVPLMKGGFKGTHDSRQIVWNFNQYVFEKWTHGFYSEHASGCQRLPNGNTLALCTEDGHFVEVTYGNNENRIPPEIVWEYINPATQKHGVVKWLKPGMGTDPIFRAYRYGPDYPGLAGKILTPKGNLTDVFAQKGNPSSK